VEARLGDLGTDRQDFQLKPGEEAVFPPALRGEVSITNSRPGMQLYAQLDGRTARQRAPGVEGRARRPSS